MFGGGIVVKSRLGKVLLLLAVLIAAVAFKEFELGRFLSLETLQERQADLNSYFSANPLKMSILFVLVYIAVTALSLPGAAVLTLAGGAVFGFYLGTALVSLASTIGATLAFLGSRFLFRDMVQAKFSGRVESINNGFKKDGALYLFTLRLVPVFPFFLVNLLMGLTPIRVLTFFLVSMIGMFPGTLVYVNAGTQLANLKSISGVLSPGLLFSFVLIGVFPLIGNFIVKRVNSMKHLRRFKRPQKYDYNMVVIGGGSAGLVSAYIAAAVKAKVALIEKHKMGGDCLNTGCVPSKALIRSAKIFNYFKRAEEFGLGVATTQVNFAHVMDRVHKVVKEIAPHDSIERYTSLGVECITGAAKIKSPFEVEVNGRVLTTKNIVVATGASPLIPSLPGLKEIPFLTSENIWSLRELPKRLLVLGGGPIGCELAQAFARFGSKVTIVEMSSRIMGREDLEVSEFVAAKFKAEGVQVLTKHKALRVEQNNLICEFSGAEVKVPFDSIFLALGRKANVQGFGLEELGVELNNNGTVAANEYLQTTNFPNIFVCGDVTGPFQFTHTASHQAWFVAVNALFNPFKSYKVDYRVIPWCTFTDPEVARVGLNEQEALEKGIPFQVTRYGIDDLDRAIAEGEAHGFVKVLTRPGSDRILGATIVGDHAGDIIGEYVAAMKHGFGLNKILGTIHIYPTLAEANKYAAGVWKKANAPKKALEFLDWFHRWRRS